MRSRRIEERAADILGLWEARKDISLEELRLAGFGGLCRRIAPVFRAAGHDA